MRLVIALFLTSFAMVSAQQQNPPAPARPDPVKSPTVLKISGMDTVRVQRNVVYSSPDGQPQKADIYTPAGAKSGQKFPVIVFISGASEAKDWMFFQSYGRLAAAQGFVGVPYDKRYPRGPAGLNTGMIDTLALLEFLRAHASDYNIDAERIVIWCYSAGGGLGTPFLRGDKAGVRAVVNYYGVSDYAPFMDDATAEQRERARAVSAATIVEQTDAAKIPPLFVARAGLDSPKLNEGIDRLAAAVLKKNVYATIVNYPDGQHAFDVFDDKERSREIMRETFAWIRDQVGK